jgi:hypothetical protein
MHIPDDFCYIMIIDSPERKAKACIIWLEQVLYQEEIICLVAENN